MSSSKGFQIRPAGLFDCGTEAVRLLFARYAESLGIDLSFQDFATELSCLPGRYAPPSGGVFLALPLDGKREGQAPSGAPNADPEAFAGCVGFRPLESGVCEMKRLFVKPEFQGFGLGRRLAATAMAEAKKAGYGKMRLDTLPSMKAAMRLYESLGFSIIPAYCFNPIPGAVYYEALL